MALSVLHVHVIELPEFDYQEEDTMTESNDSMTYNQRAEFIRMTRLLEAEFEAKAAPIDGWDATPRPIAPGIDPQIKKDEKNYIPMGHIAFKGDFVEK